MAFCNDPRRTYLNNPGYKVILLPREGIEPMDVLGKDGKSIERLGILSQMWSSSTPAPPIKPAQTAVGINGQKTVSLNLNIGLKFLSNVLGAIGATLPQLNFASQNPKMVQFSFTNVQVVGVDPLALGNHLASVSLSRNNPFVTRYFDDDTDAFVITEVLKSSSITATAQASDSTGVEVDIPSIQATVGANVSVTQTTEETTALTYTGQQLLTFGHKIFRIEFINGRWAIKGERPSVNVAFALPGIEDETGLANEQPVVFERICESRVEKADQRLG